MINRVDLFEMKGELWFTTVAGEFIYDLSKAEDLAYSVWKDDFPEYVTTENTLKFMEMPMLQREDIFEDLCDNHGLEPMYVRINEKKYENK
jgi:hypothetical protein